MSDGSTLFGIRIGPDPTEARAIHKARQAALPAEERETDPSSTARVVERARRRDEIARARHEWRVSSADD